MNDRRVLVITKAAARPTLLRFDAARLAGDANALVMSRMDDCTPAGLLAALVQIVPDDTVVPFT